MSLKQISGSESFKILREEERLFDVTLATDDGQHIQAHKMVLSAGSNFFSDIFMKTDHSNMLIYLKGISSAELEPLTDFLYNGEAFITQEYLKTFLETARELQIKGLLGHLQGVGENTSQDKKSIQQDTEHIKFEIKTEFDENIDGNQGSLDSMEEFANSFDTRDGTLINTVIRKPVLNLNQTVAYQDSPWQ